MTRSIAILTLALTTTLSADQAFAAGDGVVNGDVQAGILNVRNVPGAPMCLCNVSMYDHFQHTGISGDDDDVQWVSAASVDALIAFMAFEDDHSADPFCGDDDLWVFVSAHFLIEQVAILTIEYGPEVTYGILRDMGFSPALAEDLVLEAIAIYGVRRYLAS